MKIYKVHILYEPSGKIQSYPFLTESSILWIDKYSYLVESDDKMQWYEDATKKEIEMFYKFKKLKNL